MNTIAAIHAAQRLSTGLSPKSQSLPELTHDHVAPSTIPNKSFKSTAQIESKKDSSKLATRERTLHMYQSHSLVSILEESTDSLWY